MKLIDGHAMIGRVQELHRRGVVGLEYSLIVTEAVQMQPEAVIYCVDCALARDLEDNTKPFRYEEGAIGWHCDAWNVDMYEGHDYSATTYFCADGKRSE